MKMYLIFIVVTIIIVVLIGVAISFFGYCFLGGYWCTIWTHSSAEKILSINSKIAVKTEKEISLPFYSKDGRYKAEIVFPNIHFGVADAVANYFSKSCPCVKSSINFYTGSDKKEIMQTKPGEKIVEAVFSSDNTKIYFVSAKKIQYSSGFDSIVWISYDMDIYSVDIASGKISQLTNAGESYTKIESVISSARGDIISYKTDYYDTKNLCIMVNGDYPQTATQISCP